MRIQLKDGTYEYIDSNEQFARLVEQNIGEDAKDYVNNLINEADYENRKFNTDLGYYEESCDEYESAAKDIDEGIIEAIKYIRDSKRIDKSKLIDILDQVHKIYYENF